MRVGERKRTEKSKKLIRVKEENEVRKWSVWRRWKRESKGTGNVKEKSEISIEKRNRKEKSEGGWEKKSEKSGANNRNPVRMMQSRKEKKKKREH